MEEGELLNAFKGNEEKVAKVFKALGNKQNLKFCERLEESNLYKDGVISFSKCKGREEEISQYFKALGHPYSIKIYDMLSRNGNKPLSVMGIAYELYYWKNSVSREYKPDAKVLRGTYLVQTQRILRRLKEVGAIELRMEHIQRNSRGRPTVNYVKLVKPLSTIFS